jgi:catechol 2,3-dioxygenase-like lactoylglutathione lyase family enzyme
MLHHLTLWVPDLERAEASWSWLLGELGYHVERPFDGVAAFREEGGFAIVLEQSADMVPGMLYSRLRPGMNHLALTVESPDRLHHILARAGEHGWSVIPTDQHRLAADDDVGYLEDGDGFEVELVARRGG